MVFSLVETLQYAMSGTMAVSLILGIVLSVLLFTIGLWRTLLLFVIVGIAAYFGMMLDKKGGDGVVRFFNDLFKQK